MGPLCDSTNVVIELVERTLNSDHLDELIYLLLAVGCALGEYAQQFMLGFFIVDGHFSTTETII